MVAALAVSGPAARRHACVYVYCCEGGALLRYDFGGQGRVPRALAWDAADARLLGVQTTVG